MEIEKVQESKETKPNAEAPRLLALPWHVWSDGARRVLAVPDEEDGSPVIVVERRRTDHLGDPAWIEVCRHKEASAWGDTLERAILDSIAERNGADFAPHARAPSRGGR